MRALARLPETPLAGDAQAFIDHCLDRDMSLATVETYTQVLSSFLVWMASSYPEVTSVTQISLAHLQSFRRHLRISSAANGRELSPGTVTKYLSTLRSLLKFYTVQIGVQVVAREHVVLPPAVKLRRVFGRDDLERLLSTPPVDRLWGLRDRAIIALLGRAGLRLNELCALNRRDVREDLLVRSPNMVLTVSGGARESRQVSIDAETQHWLREYLEARRDSYQPLFIRHKPGKGLDFDDPQHRLTRQMVNRMLVKYAKQAQLLTLPSVPLLRQAAMATVSA